MTTSISKASAYRRPSLERSAPLRGAGQMYRSAEGPGTALGGVPLSSAEDAVVAAVRMGYRVAQAQVDRAARIGERMRQAGERAVGAEPERQAVDATERLVSKALLTTLEWLEGLAAEPGSPLRRYATTQYKLLGALLGLQVDAAAPAAPASAAPSEPPTAREPARERARRGVKVMHRDGARRAVQPLRLHLDRPVEDSLHHLLFYGAAHCAGSVFQADLEFAAGQAAVLHITTAADSPAGIWKAAICAPDGEQLGWIEIEL